MALSAVSLNDSPSAWLTVGKSQNWSLPKILLTIRCKGLLSSLSDDRRSFDLSASVVVEAGLNDSASFAQISSSSTAVLRVSTTLMLFSSVFFLAAAFSSSRWRTSWSESLEFSTSIWPSTFKVSFCSWVSGGVSVGNRSTQTADAILQGFGSQDGFVSLGFDSDDSNLNPVI